jgi:hypothetical protein
MGNFQSIVTMIGFHAAKLRQNEIFHHHNQMNTIILTHNGKKGSKLSHQVFVEKLTTVQWK